MSRRIATVAIAALVLALLGGGVGAGIVRQQRVAEAAAARSAPAARPGALARYSATGRIVALSGDRVTVRDARGRLREVRLTDWTVVRRKGKRVAPIALAPGDWVAAVGAPGQGGSLVARVLVAAPAPAPGSAPTKQ